MPRQFRNLVVIVAAIGLPILGQHFATKYELSDYTQGVLFRIGLNITLAVGLSLIIGFAGQFSIGHAGFMSLGAFAAGMFTSWMFLNPETGELRSIFHADFLNGDSNAWASLARAGLFLVSMLVGMIAAGVASFVVGLPSLRLRGDYLAIATMGFGEITYNLLNIYLNNKYHDTAYYMDYRIGFMSKPVNIASSWMLALVAILIVRNLISSTSGRALPAIREDEIAASAVGIRNTRYKMIAFVVGSLLAGAAGVLESNQTQTFNPGSYRFDRSIEMIVPVVLGGSGSLTGTVVAAGLFTYLLEKLRDLPSGAQQYRTIVYAGALVVFMILRPQGLMGRFELGDVWGWVARRFRRARPRIGEAALTATIGAQSGLRLECSRLTIRFGGLTAVNEFNLCLGPGEIVGLIGPNGAGKTTCFNMITGVYKPTSGDIRLSDRVITGMGCARINNRGIARTFQNIRLFSDLSVLDNVRIALHAHLKTGLPAAVLRTPKFYREEARTQALAMELLALFGLDEMADEIAGSLPYGDQRRLEIARALATRPRVLCLDEPAAGMNPAEKRELMDLIRRIRDKFSLAILLIEHDMKVVMGVCERILVLDHGETIAAGTPEEIRNNSKVIEAYLGEPMKAACVQPPR